MVNFASVYRCLGETTAQLFGDQKLYLDFLGILGKVLTNYLK